MGRARPGRGAVAGTLVRCHVAGLAAVACLRPGRAAAQRGAGRAPPAGGGPIDVAGPARARDGDAVEARSDNNRTLGGAPVFARCEDRIGQRPGPGGPGGIGPDAFSARWSGQPALPGGTYTLVARVWPDGALIADAWPDRAATAESRATRTLPAGPHAVEVGFYERNGPAELRVTW